MNNLPTQNQLLTSLKSQNLPLPSSSFLATLLTSTSTTTTTSSTTSNLPPSRALLSLTATARSRLLSSSILTPNLLDPSTPSFPADISSVHIVTRVLEHDIFVEVVDIQDLGRSLGEEIEGLERVRKGEFVKGREVIRVVDSSNVDEDVGSSASTQLHNHQGGSGSGNGNGAMMTAAAAVGGSSSKGPFKILIQDHKGTQTWAFEMKKVDKIGYPYPPGAIMNLGCKIMLKKGCPVARGLILLDPSVCVALGGKVEALDRQWKEGREERLRAKVRREVEERSNSNSGE